MTTNVKTAPVKAFEVGGFDDPQANVPGAVWLRQDGRDWRKRVYFACLCGCGEHGNIIDGADGWTISGEWPALTASPSIGFATQSSGQYHWHGYLERGWFVNERNEAPME